MNDKDSVMTFDDEKDYITSVKYYCHFDVVAPLGKTVCFKKKEFFNDTPFYLFSNVSSFKNLI